MQNSAGGGQLGADLKLGLMLLTRLPVPAPFPDPTRSAAAAWTWPIIGAGLGLVAAALGGIGSALGLPPFLAAALALAGLVIITGALHEDGLADTADGLWGGRTPTARLAIMRDSRIGSYGVIALIFSILLRWGGIVALATAEAWLALSAATALARVSPAVLMAGWRPARPDGLSQATGRPKPETVAAAFLLGLACAWLAAGGVAFLLAGIIVIATFMIGHLAQSRIGGQTGDILGAGQQVSEAAALLVLAAALS